MKLYLFVRHRWYVIAWRGPLVLVAGLVLLAGCGGDGNGDSPSDGGADKEQSTADALPSDPTELKALKTGSWKQSWLAPDAQRINFVIAIPGSIAKDEPMPLVLALHQGADRTQFHQFFGEQFLRHLIMPGLVNVPAIVVSPDVIRGTWTNEACESAVMALMDKICKTYNVDRKRVLVTGYSLGGRGAWHLARNHPDFFTAAVVIAGTPPSNIAESEWHVPILCIQSAADSVCPIEKTRQAISALREKGFRNIELYELADINHYESVKYVEPFITAMDWILKVWDSQTPQ